MKKLSSAQSAMIKAIGTRGRCFVYSFVLGTSYTAASERKTINALERRGYIQIQSINPYERELTLTDKGSAVFVALQALESTCKEGG